MLCESINRHYKQLPIMDSAFWSLTPAEDPQQAPALDDADETELFDQHEPLGADTTSALQPIDWESVRIIFACLSMVLLLSVLILFLEGAFAMSSRSVDTFFKDFRACRCACGFRLQSSASQRALG